MSNFCSECGHRLSPDNKFCPECGTRVEARAPENAEPILPLVDNKAEASREELYDVFLSYSHKDRDKFGMEYIERIKAEIEKSLETIITDHVPRVFLDAEALQLGDHWHSKIMESLNQCKAVVCLVSEAYLKSEYCTRERLWWNAKQTHAGRFLDGPYPVYFVKLEEGIFSERREVKEMMAVQTDPLPWFEARKQLQEEFIRERLKPISAAVSDKVRAAGLVRGSFCSVLPPLYENFVGRVTELRELHELCVNGQYPVIQAAGGVGKTELSVAYAYGFADRYPMGRFLFRMERVTSWDEAFSKALELAGTDAHGVTKKVFEELNIKKEDLEGKDQGKIHETAAKSFLERAAKGKLLILLDNLDEDTILLKKMRDFLCGNPLPENIHILATTRGSFNFSEREKFRSYELKNLKEDEAFEMICLTGNGQYPFDKQPPSGENREYQSAHEVIRFLDGHAWSMEIVSAFMADNYDPEGFNFAMELESLRKNLILSSESGVTYRAGESSATSVELLRPTLEKLATLELGAETLELAVFAACFDPDEIPVYLLKEYWEKNFPDVTCTKGVPFIYAVNLLAKYHLIRKDKGICKMHRLMQAVFLSHKDKYLSHILKTLPKCSFVPPKYWVPILLQNPELADICPQDGILAGNDWAKLLVDPAFAEKCPWQSFDGGHWAHLLEEQPQFADKCDWSKLSERDWARLLDKQPQFTELHCNFNELGGGGWADLLEKQPQFADKCDWSKLDGWDWARLLSTQPQFADKCDWSKLDGGNLADLLTNQPQFADKCDMRLLDVADGFAWAKLLAKQPQFADKCDWSKLNDRDWGYLLCERPEFAAKCDWSKLDGYAWARLLGSQPQFADKCDWSILNGQAWSNLLCDQPQFADKCDWSKLDGRDWSILLEKQPQFADNCDWSKLDGWAWGFLLGKHPEWYTKINFLRLDSLSLAQLAGLHPQFVEYCDFDQFDGKSWSCFIKEQPQFADCCDWSKLDGDDWSRLLRHQPQFSCHCNWSLLGGSDWNGLLRFRPQFAEKCDLSKLSEEDRQDLLEKFPGLFGK